MYAKAAEHGHVSVIRWLREFTPQTLASSVKNDGSGRGFYMSHWRELFQGNMYDIYVPDRSMYDAAADAGQICVFEYLYPKPPSYYDTNATDACSRAAYNGHLECIQWLLRRGFSSECVHEQSLKGEHTEVIEWVNANVPRLQYRRGGN